MNTLCLALALLSVSQAAAGDIDIVSGHRDAIWFHGDVNVDDSDKLQAVMDYRTHRNLATNWIILESNGGLVIESFRLATIISHYGLDTMVTGTCASACFTMFAVGRTRWVGPSTHLGVHSATLNAQEDMAMSVVLARKYREMGIPASIIGKLITTSNTDISWLTWDDLRGWARDVRDGQ